jgi:hypothetical protein
VIHSLAGIKKSPDTVFQCRTFGLNAFLTPIATPIGTIQISPIAKRDIGKRDRANQKNCYNFHGSEFLVILELRPGNFLRDARSINFQKIISEKASIKFCKSLRFKSVFVYRHSLILFQHLGQLFSKAVSCSKNFLVVIDISD